MLLLICVYIKLQKRKCFSHIFGFVFLVKACKQIVLLSCLDIEYTYSPLFVFPDFNKSNVYTLLHVYIFLFLFFVVRFISLNHE